MLTSDLSELTEYHLGTNIDVSTYTRTNPYVAPKDGYAVLAFRTEVGKQGYIRIEGAINAATSILMGTTSNRAYENIALFVKKGMCLSPEQITSSNYAAIYIPIG